MASLRGIVLSLALVTVSCGQTPQPRCEEVRNTQSSTTWIYIPGGCSPDTALNRGKVVAECILFGNLFCVVDTNPPTIPTPVCGVRVNAKVVRGTNQEQCVPWLASVQWKVQKSGNTYTVCSAVLVSQNRLLSAASCFGYNIYGAETQVVIGDKNTTVVEPEEQVRKVQEIVFHPGYNSVTKENNIAVIKLETEVPLTVCSVPICLPSSVDDYDTRTCHIGGYGKKNVTDVELPDAPQVAAVLVVPKMFCSNQPDNTICTLLTTDACEGDDGGMLACADQNSKWQLAGLIGDPSTYRCGTGFHPSYHTDVVAHMDWIKSQL